MKHFTRNGYAPYCAVRYADKRIDCIYPSMNACRENYNEKCTCVCFPAKDIPFPKEKKK